MACNLTKGRITPCRDVVGGIAEVYFVDFGGLGTLTLDASDVITDASGTFNAYRYQLKGTSSMTQTVTASRENGTVFFSQALSLTLPKLSADDNKELKLLAYGRPHIVVVDYNGNALLLGREHGCDVTGGTLVSGAAMGDLIGYTIEFEAQELMLSNFIQNPVAANPFAGLSSATETIVSGADF